MARDTWGFLSGLLFSLAFLAGNVAIDWEQSDITTDEGKQAVAGAWLLGLAVVCLIRFLGSLSAKLGDDALGSFARTGGTLLAVIVLVGAAAQTAMPISIGLELHDAAPAGGLVDAFQSLQVAVMWVVGAPVIAATLIGYGWSTSRAGTGAMWYKWVSIVLGVLALIPYLILPTIALALWALLSAYLIWSTDTAKA